MKLKWKYCQNFKVVFIDKLKPKQKEQVKKDILQQVIEQSPEIKEMATKEVDAIINTSDEEKVKYINRQLEKLDSELDSILGSTLDSTLESKLQQSLFSFKKGEKILSQ